MLEVIVIFVPAANLAGTYKVPFEISHWSAIGRVVVPVPPKPVPITVPFQVPDFTVPSCELVATVMFVELTLAIVPPVVASILVEETLVPTALVKLSVGKVPYPVTLIFVPEALPKISCPNV